MSDRVKKAIKSATIVVSSIALFAMANLFAGVTCGGRAFEPKMPEKLREKCQ